MTFVVPQRSTNGSTYNRAGLSAEETDVAMAQLDWQHHAFNCSNQKVKYFMTRRSVFSVHNEPPHLMVGKIFFQTLAGLPGQAREHWQSELRTSWHNGGPYGSAWDVCERVWSNQRVGLNDVWASPL